MEEKHFGPVWFIPGENKGRYPYCHSIYIEEAEILIDPSSDRKRLLELKNENGVKEIWLSHWHEDHFMHLDLFDETPLCMMEADAHPLSDLEILLDAYGIDEKFKNDWRFVLNNTFHFKPRKPSRFLKDDEWLDLGSTKVKIITAAGHTPGHMALFFEAPQLLFMGDYDLSKFGPWYGDVNSSIEKTISSVNKLRQIPAKIWLTSHEKGIFEEEPGELWDQYCDVIKIREQKLLDLLQTPRTIEQIIDACIIYRKKREPRYFFEFGEKVHMEKHLTKLINEDIVFWDAIKYSIKI